MRNIFDQYEQPENRVTHALASALANDAKLLRQFVLLATGNKPPSGELTILEQSLPGELGDVSEEESERRGLPDACIVGPDGWALIIESKVAAAVNRNQLERHLRTAERRGLVDCSLLLLTAASYKTALPPRVVTRAWASVYQWLVRYAPQSSWAAICAHYLEVAEARGAADGYLKEGALTVFAGIPFDADNPYTYEQGKRVLGLLRSELLEDKRLERQLGVDRDHPGRGAITGRASRVVWDIVALKSNCERANSAFTNYLHLSLGIADDNFGVSLTLPNGLPASIRRAVIGEELKTFEKLIGEVTRGIVRALKTCHGAVPRITVVQRHYQSQRSIPTRDASLEFDPRTAVPVGPAKSRVRNQPEWLRATYDAMRSRTSNLQFQIGAHFPYANCPQVRSPQIRDLAAGVWLASRPIIEAARKGVPGLGGRGPGIVKSKKRRRK